MLNKNGIVMPGPHCRARKYKLNFFQYRRENQNCFLKQKLDSVTLCGPGIK